MTTIQFSTPEYVKKQFLDTFEGENKGQVLTKMMCEAIQRKKTEERRREMMRRVRAWFMPN
jgi:hypothetical protein